MTVNEYHLPDLNDVAELIGMNSQRLGFRDQRVRPFDGMLMNVVGEVAEALEEWRNGKGFNETYWNSTVPLDPDILRWEDDKLYFRASPTKFRLAPEWEELTPEKLRGMPNLIKWLKPEGIPSELADIIIRVLDICSYYRIDIAAAIADKMAYNETRQMRHGGKRS